MGRIVLLFFALAAAAAAAGGVRASSPPVGPLPDAPKATVTTKAGELVAVALPHRSGGRVWRIAGAFNGSIVHQVSEADVGSNVVLVFKATRTGIVTIAFALTKGASTKAFDARTFEVHVR